MGIRVVLKEECEETRGKGNGLGRANGESGLPQEAADKAKNRASRRAAPALLYCPWRRVATRSMHKPDYPLLARACSAAMKRLRMIIVTPAAFGARRVALNQDSVETPANYGVRH